MSVMFVVFPVGVEPKDPVAVFASRKAAEEFTAGHRFDTDGYHDWSIAEVPVDPVEVRTWAVCPSAPDFSFGNRGSVAHRFPLSGEGACADCGYDR